MVFQLVEDVLIVRAFPIQRVALPDAFFAIDGLLETLLAVLNQMDVFAAAIGAENQRQLPFLATTTILM